MLKVKLVLAALISIVPINMLRVLGYRLLGYKVNGRIGFGTVIAVSEARIEKCKIGVFNLFVGPMKVEISEGASIGNRNTFSCGFWTIQEQYQDKKYARSLQIGANTLITSGHYFDVAGLFDLGDGSWIAGIGSQFWTHGAGVTDRDIQVGRDCYLGSAVRFSPGSSVGDNVIVAMGSVITKKFDISKAMLGGVPATVLKKDYDWKLEK
jgi:acetyltransferase-like isoleucine patch superfamily enzyme